MSFCEKKKLEFTNKPVIFTSVYNMRVKIDYEKVIEKLKLHGIQMEIVEQNVEKELAQYMINEYEIDPNEWAIWPN